MFDTSSRKFALRRTHNVYGHDDRRRFKYWGDTFNRFQDFETEKVIKEAFVGECVSPLFNGQNIDALENSKYIKNCEEIVQKVYLHLFEDTLQQAALTSVATSAALTSALIDEAKSVSAVLEIGGGNGLTAACYLSFLAKPRVYYLVEAVPELLVLQQSVLRTVSLMTGSFDYISDLNQFDQSQKRRKPVIVHVSAWDFERITGQVDMFFGGRVLDQITDQDFEFYSKNIERLKSNKSKCSFWGGLELGGVQNIFLYGIGTYLNVDVVHGIKQIFKEAKIEKRGSEYLLSTMGTQPKNTVAEIELAEIKKQVKKADFLWVDDNADFVEDFKECEELQTMTSLTSSVNVTPLPLGISRGHIDDLKKKKNLSLLVFSYRVGGVVKVLQNKGFKASARRISQRITYLELTDDNS